MNYYLDIYIYYFIYFIYIRYLDTTVTINKSNTMSHFPITEELDMEGHVGQYGKRSGITTILQLS